jgi:hypothetical protein
MVERHHFAVNFDPEMHALARIDPAQLNAVSSRQSLLCQIWAASTTPSWPMPYDDLVDHRKAVDLLSIVLGSPRNSTDFAAEANSCSKCAKFA